MSVIIKRPVTPTSAPQPTPPTKSRRRPLDECARKLAPILAELRDNEIEGTEEIMKALDARGILSRSGKPWTFGATHRLKWRVYELGLGPKPRSGSQFVSSRSLPPRASRQSSRVAGRKAFAELNRAHPEILN